MSCVLSYHTGEFGIVCSDSRVSTTLPDGRRVAVTHETVRRKFIVLRPGLVLCGSSSIAKFLDFAIYESLRRHVEDFPEASFDQVARIIGPTVYEARAAFGVPSDTPPRTVSRAREVGRAAGRIFGRVAGKFLRAPSSSPELFDEIPAGNFLNLLGYDRLQGRVRNRVFDCTDYCEESEQKFGVTILGFMERGEAWDFAGKLLELVQAGGRATPSVVVETMLTIGAQISAPYPETIGPPWAFHLVTRPSCDVGIIEEQFRRAVALAEKRTAPGAPKITGEVGGR